MTYTAYSSVRHLLINDVNVSSQLGTSNIRVGFGNIGDSYPLLTITKVGGSSYGYTGWKTSDHGSKQRREDNIFQIDIYSRDSVQQLEEIGEDVNVALMSGNGFRKINDNNMFEPNLKSHRKIQRWSFFEMKYD